MLIQHSTAIVPRMPRVILNEIVVAGTVMLLFTFEERGIGFPLYMLFLLPAAFHDLQAALSREIYYLVAEECRWCRHGALLGAAWAA